MVDSSKRKACQGDDNDNRRGKRSKGGSGGKWQTPHQLAKIAASRGCGKIEAGDIGIWATCAKGQEGRATEELKSIFEDCAERFYGIVAGSEEIEGEDDSVGDIESSIRKEVASMKKSQHPAHLFSPVHVDLHCVLFFKTRSPIDPVNFVHKICEEAVSIRGVKKSRYVNRLTPMTLMGKATEKGLEEVGKKVLGEHFQLAGEGETGDDPRTGVSCSYAIRPTIRNHSTLTRDAVIKQVAALVGEKHKVDLTKPDKVIIVEIYQTVCGMCVTGSDWDELKRFNLAELYQTSYKHPRKSGSDVKAEAIPETVKTDEARLPSFSTNIDS